MIARDPQDVVPDLIDVGIREALRDRVAPTRSRTGTVTGVDYTAQTADVRVDGDAFPTQTRLLCEAFIGARVVVDFTTGGGVWCKGIIGGAAVWLQYQVAWTTTISPPVLGNGSLRGWFMRSGTNCGIQIELLMGSTTSGGTGEMYFSVPFPNGSPAEQTLSTARIWHPTIASHYHGCGVIQTGAAHIITLMPINSTDNRMQHLRNADATAAAGTGIPQLLGLYPLVSGGRLHIEGSYRVA